LILVVVPKLPIYSAAFVGDSGKVVVSGRRPFFYIYDAAADKITMINKIIGREEKSLEKCVTNTTSGGDSNDQTIAFCGNDGYVLLYDVHQQRPRNHVKMNGSCRSMTFTNNCHSIYTSGSDGDVYQWDLRYGNSECVQRFDNDDGTCTTSLAYHSSNPYHQLAVGAQSGVVNLYEEGPQLKGDNLGIVSAKKTPTKSIMNLQTSVDHMSFNHDGQILAISTRRDRNNSLKLVHAPTQTVFANWPTSKTPLNYVWTTAFSPGSQFFAIGNDKGKCLLYRVLHYEDDEE
jgi:U3 small nucleolar RNA-associated protein 18